MTKSMTLRIDDDQAELLEAVARVEGSTVSEVVRAAIADRVEDRRNDKAFRKRLSQIVKQDRELLERLAK